MAAGGASTGPIETESRLLAAAAEVFAERGYDGAGVAEIARRAGLTTGAIYSRYRGKAELLVEALDAIIADHLEAVITSGGPATGPEMLATLGAQILEGDEQDELSAALLLEATVAARRDPLLAAMLERRLEDERMRVTKILDQARAEGLFDPALDTEAVLTFIQALGLGFVMFRTMGTPMPDAEAWQVWIDRVISAALPPD
ncbi:MAG: helix-turn-helix domain-containing protein [Actinomycetota bacterium]